jgi:hypothetical protein
MYKHISIAMALAMTASTASAETVKMGDVTVNLPAPSGFCELTPSKNSDKIVLTTNAKLLDNVGAKLLSMSADCHQLAEQRASEREVLDDYARYQTPKDFIDTPPVESIAETCKTLRGEGNKIVAEESPDWHKNIEATIKDTKVNSTTFIGVLAEDPKACYAGLVKQFNQGGASRTRLTLFAVTIVRNRSVAVHRSFPHKGSNSIIEGLEHLKSDVARFYAAN